MKKEKKYMLTKFSPQTIKNVIELVDKIGGDNEFNETYKVSFKDETWNYDKVTDFFANYRKEHEYSLLWMTCSNVRFEMQFFNCLLTSISIESESKENIDKLFEFFEDDYPKCIQECDHKKTSPLVFIGHGRSEQWVELKTHLVDLHNIEVTSFESGARAGHSIRDVIEKMAGESSFAILVLTGEDEIGDGTLNPRLNVVHETGLFQGKLGFSKAIVLLEEGTNEFSNIHGIVQLRFSKDNIKEVFGDVIATINREFR